MRRVWLISFGLFLMAFAVFSRVLIADFVQWDDGHDVYQNPHLKGLNLETLRWMFTDLRYVWRYTPLAWLTREIIYEFQGAAPFGYHLVSLVVHSLNTVWLFLLIRKLLPIVFPAESQAAPNAREWVCPALGALLWAVHPLRVEPVAWVAGYLHCQSLFFMLLSLWFYLEAVTAPGNKGKRWRYWLSVLSYLASLFSFPSALGLVPLLVILDVYPLNRFRHGPGRWWNATARRIWLEKTPFVALALLAVGIGLLVRFHPQPRWPQPVSLVQFSLFARAMQACYVWAYFLWKPWAPFGLSPLYSTLVEFRPAAWPFLLCGASVAGVTVWLAWKRCQWPWALALWAAYLVLLVPMLGLTEHPHFTADRYNYLPGVVWAMAIAAALWKLSTRPRWRVAGMTCALALALFWAALSLRQVRVWQNSETLFTYMLHELGNDPCAADIHWRLGWVLARQGKTDAAVQHYQTSLQIRPTANTYGAFGRLMETNGNPEAALTNYQGMLRLKPDAVAFAKVGALLSKLGRTGEASSFYRTALIAYPNLAPVLNNLAWRFATDPDATKRNGAEAVQLAEVACTLTAHQNPIPLSILGAAYAEAGRFKEAIETAQKARDLAQAAGQPQLAEKNRQLLELYRSGQACRELPPPANATSEYAR